MLLKYQLTLMELPSQQPSATQLEFNK